MKKQMKTGIRFYQENSKTSIVTFFVTQWFGKFTNQSGVWVKMRRDDEVALTTPHHLRSNWCIMAFASHHSSPVDQNRQNASFKRVFYIFSVLRNLLSPLLTKWCPFFAKWSVLTKTSLTTSHQMQF